MKLRFLFFLPIALATAPSSGTDYLDKDAEPLKVSTSLLYTDNLNPTISPERSAYGGEVDMRGELLATSDGIWIGAKYLGNYRYVRSEENPDFERNQDFYNVQGQLLSRFFMTDRWFVDVSYQRQFQVQEFGTGISRQRRDVTEADELDRSQTEIALTYGSDATKRSLRMSAGQNRFDYTVFGVDVSPFDVDVNYAAVDIGFSLSSLTRFVSQVSMRTEEFEQSQREDSDVYSAMMGISWKPSGKSELQALVGGFQRQFSESDDRGGLKWQIDYTFRPDSVWTWHLNSARFSDTSDSLISTDSITQRLASKLTLKANDVWHYQIGLRWDEQEFFTPEFSTQQTEKNLAFTALANLKQHMRLSLSVAHRDVESSDRLNDFQQTEVNASWVVDF